MSEPSGRAPHFRSGGPEGRLRRHLSRHPNDPEAHAVLGLLASIAGMLLFLTVALSIRWLAQDPGPAGGRRGASAGE